jgi:hypothetical protein
LFTFDLATRCRPVRYAAALATVAAGVGAMLAMTSAADAATMPGPSSGTPAWSIMSTPNPTGGGGLSAISCTSASSCTAVGSNSSAARATLAEHWNGTTWAIQATPNPSGAEESKLFGVSCASASACTAVGYYYNGSVQPVLAEHWNGKKWAIQTTPSGIVGIEMAVSCTAPWACTAVGYYANSGGTAVTLAERWNGKTWAVQTTPNPAGSSGNYLDGVLCTSAWVCTAVGYYYNNSTGYTQPLAERWNGKAWVIQSVPTISNDNVQLSGVSCPSASACTAVGSYVSFTGSPGTVAERWNGKTWAMQSIPNPTTVGDSLQLAGVSCASASACTAVGSYDASDGGTIVTLGEHWNGTAWAVQSTPNPPGDGSPYARSSLDGVSCTSASACIAAGSAVPEGTLAERYGLSS